MASKANAAMIPPTAASSTVTWRFGTVRYRNPNATEVSISGTSFSTAIVSSGACLPSPIDCVTSQDVSDRLPPTSSGPMVSTDQ